MQSIIEHGSKTDEIEKSSNSTFIVGEFNIFQQLVEEQQ